MASRNIFFFQDELPSAAARLKPVDVERLSIAAYDVDNGYPQRMIRLIKASPTAKMVTELYADFIFGQGFAVGDGTAKYKSDSEDGVWNQVFNRKGHTGDDLLALAAADGYSRFEKFWAHINYNALFQGVELSIIPFETVRYGIGDRAGQVAVYDNWWNSGRFGKYISEEKITWIDLYNPDPEVIKQQVKRAGGWANYNGQAFCFGKDFENYPEMVLDSCLDSIETEILAKKTTKANVKNNFGDKVVIKLPPAESDDQREKVQSGWRNFIGPEGEQVIIAEIDDPLNPAFAIDKIENKLDDKKFQFSTEDARATMYRNRGQSAVLHSDLNQGRYNQNQLPEAIKAYNNRTERARINMQRAFKQLFGIMGIDTDASIVPLEDLTSASQNTDGANSTPDASANITNTEN